MVKTPKEIVAQLDAYVIGQDDAKKPSQWPYITVIAACSCQKPCSAKLPQRIYS